MTGLINLFLFSFVIEEYTACAIGCAAPGNDSSGLQSLLY